MAEGDGTEQQRCRVGNLLGKRAQNIINVETAMQTWGHLDPLTRARSAKYQNHLFEHKKECPVCKANDKGGQKTN